MIDSIGVGIVPVALDSSDLLSFVHSLADRLGLSSWQIDIAPDSPEDVPFMAEIHMADGCLATITFAAAFYKASATEQLETIVHELCHTFFALADDLIEEWGDTFPKANMEAFKAAFSVLEEHSVSRLANAFVKTLPALEQPFRKA